mmetsp:Transcript_34711/g.83872  ORF Transcript_34711/g.83872 Transcript_34711/m.83872 type:complete len:131 (+) Transcript_34711:54-446(+)
MMQIARRQVGVAVSRHGRTQMNRVAFAGVRYFCADVGRVKSLMWRAKQRGWLELDLLIGTFAKERLSNFSDAELTMFEEVLELENPDMNKWLTGQVDVPEELHENKVLLDLVKYAQEGRPTFGSNTVGQQ